MGVSYEISGNHLYLFLDTADANDLDRELIFLPGEGAAISITPAALPAAPEQSTIAMLGPAGMVRRRLTVFLAFHHKIGPLDIEAALSCSTESMGLALRTFLKPWAITSLFFLSDLSGFLLARLFGKGLRIAVAYHV